MSQKKRRFGSTSSEFVTISASFAFEPKSWLQDNLQHMFEHFGSEVFFVRDAQGFPSYKLQREYAEEEANFKKQSILFWD